MSDYGYGLWALVIINSLVFKTTRFYPEYISEHKPRFDNAME